ncbi:MAG TPA: hypothetical protein V6C78_08815 [Crinalium sp.]
MSEENVLERVRQGDPKAIAYLMSQLLQPQGVTVKANRKDQTLLVVLESSQVPDETVMVPFVQAGLANLKIPSIQTVRLYGKQASQPAPTWSREFFLNVQTATGDELLQVQLPRIDVVLEPPPEPIAYVPPPTFIHPDPPLQPSEAEEPPNVQPIAPVVPPLPRATRGVGKMLLASLWLRIGFDGLFILYSLVWATYYIYYFLDIADTTGFWAYLINQLMQAVDQFFIPLEQIANGIYWATVLFMLLWLHRFHARLRQLFNDYPISPWGAVARFAIPFYNFWGIWNLFTTLARRVGRVNRASAQYGKVLKRWLPIFYISFLASNGLRQVYWAHVDPQTGQDEVALWLYVLRNGSALVLSIAWLKLVRGAMQAIAFVMRSRDM